MSRDANSTLMFVGRVERIKHHSEPGTYVYRFRILTPGQGSGSLALSYPDKRTALTAQATLLRAEHSHYVGSKKLFEAIWAGLEALEKQVQQSVQ